jgi:hypothetical protein
MSVVAVEEFHSISSKCFTAKDSHGDIFSNVRSVPTFVCSAVGST